MGSVFISSVIDGFEEQRKAVKEAVELMDHTPIMSENFSARPYSSGIACINEVEQSDIYLLILGPSYGLETDQGISVTHSEYRAAREANRPILAFAEKCEMEAKQSDFRSEVESYRGGVFRASFSTQHELKDQVIKALRQLETMNQVVSEEAFKTRIDEGLTNFEKNWNDETELILAFLPQPERMVDIVGMENEMDTLFKTLCDSGIAQLRDGYDVLTEAHWTGLKTGRFCVGCFADGLILLLTNPTVESDSRFSGYFVPPENIESMAIGFFSLINIKSGYVHIGLRNMNNTYVATPPSGNSFSMGLFAGEDQTDFSRIFVPLTMGAYEDWIGHCVKRFSRIFQYKGN